MSSGNDRLAIVAALDALEVGDQDYAVAILLGALEDGPAERRHVCPGCRNAYEWPGLLMRHQDVTDCGVVEVLARAA